MGHVLDRGSFTRRKRVSYGQAAATYLLRRCDFIWSGVIASCESTIHLQPTPCFGLRAYRCWALRVRKHKSITACAFKAKKHRCHLLRHAVCHMSMRMSAPHFHTSQSQTQPAGALPKPETIKFPSSTMQQATRVNEKKVQSKIEW